MNQTINRFFVVRFTITYYFYSYHSNLKKSSILCKYLVTSITTLTIIDIMLIFLVNSTFLPRAFGLSTSLKIVVLSFRYKIIPLKRNLQNHWLTQRSDQLLLHSHPIYNSLPFFVSFLWIYSLYFFPISLFYFFCFLSVVMLHVK